MSSRQFPLFRSLAGYDKRWLRGDMIAGLTVWAVLVPEALAYASIAGVSPVVGLYAAPPALVLYAAFGSSRHLVTGPMSATAALSATSLAGIATGDNFAAFTAVLAIMTGAIAIFAGLLRLGFLANFISEPVLKGFIVGLALTIIIGQVPKLFGVEKESGNFFEQAWGFLGNLGDTQGRTLAVGLLSLALVLGLREFAPKIPGSLVAVIFGVVVVELFDLADKGVTIVGHIDSGLPRVGIPQGVGAGDYLAVAGSAAAVMLVGFAEGLGAAKTYATQHHYEIDANHELLGLGAANLGAGFCSGMVVNGSLSKTAVNGSAGAKTQISGMFVAVLTIITLLFLTGLFEDLPDATLAAVVIAAVVELVDFASIRGFYRMYTTRLGQIYGKAARIDFIASITAMLGVLIFDTLPGLILGIIVSILLLLYRSSKPHVAELGQVVGAPGQYGDVQRHPENVTVPGVAVLRAEAGLFFANSDAVRNAIKLKAEEPGTKAVILDAEAIPFVDVTAAKMLQELAADLARVDVRFVIAHELGQVGDILTVEPSQSELTFYSTVDAALAAIGPTL